MLPHPTSDPKTPRGAGRRSQRRHPAGSRAWPHVTPTTCSALQDGQGKALGISDRNLLPSQFRNSKTRRPWAAWGRLRREEREGQGHFRAPSSFHEVQIQSFIDLNCNPRDPHSAWVHPALLQPNCTLCFAHPKRSLQRGGMVCETPAQHPGRKANGPTNMEPDVVSNTRYHLWV